jgi:formate hydrogenlyase transcriptional activator
MAAPLQWAHEACRASSNSSFEIELEPVKRLIPGPTGNTGRAPSQIFGNSAALRHVLDMVRTVGPADATVLITGETGTGKELIAHAIHNLSNRSGGPFVRVNCAAIPAGLLESELFGHERGAFTGAFAQRVGRFEAAARGTLFLDEVGEIPLELQAKLLRVLQEREFERLGSSRTVKTDARVVAATNCDLSTMVSERRFRADLYYRLNVFPIELPPLRQRLEDIPLLVRHFVSQFSQRMNKRIDTIAPATMEALMRYDWPGNVRELQNIIERAVILSTDTVLTLPARNSGGAAGAVTSKNHVTLRAALHEMERQKILTALDRANWTVAGPNGAAALLGVKRTTLASRMKALGIIVQRVHTRSGAIPCSALTGGPILAHAASAVE